LTCYSNEHETLKKELPNILNVIQLLQEQKNITHIKHIHAFLRQKNLEKYLKYSDIFTSIIVRKKDINEFYYRWKLICELVDNMFIINALFTLWWNRVPHTRNYCVNPVKFAEGLLIFSKQGDKGLLEMDSKNFKEERIKDYLILGLVKHNAASVIQRSWRAYVKRKNDSAKIIQEAWRNCIANPSFSVCRKRLRREFESESDNLMGLNS
jgi:hypothetical protein